MNYTNNNQILNSNHINLQISNQKNENIQKNFHYEQPNNLATFYNNSNTANRTSDCCDLLICYLCMNCYADCFSCCRINFFLFFWLINLYYFKRYKISLV